MVYIRNEILGGQRDKKFRVALTQPRSPPYAGPSSCGSKEQGLFGLLYGKALNALLDTMN